MTCLPPAPNARPFFSWYDVDPLLKKGSVFTMETRVVQKTLKEVGIWSRGYVCLNKYLCFPLLVLKRIDFTTGNIFFVQWG